MDWRILDAFLAGLWVGKAHPGSGELLDEEGATWDAVPRAGEKMPPDTVRVRAAEVSFDADYVLLGGERLLLKNVQEAFVVMRLAGVRALFPWLPGGGLLLCAASLAFRSPWFFALGAAAVVLAALLLRRSPHRLEIRGSDGNARSWAVTDASASELRDLRRELLRRRRAWEERLDERRSRAGRP